MFGARVRVRVRTRAASVVTQRKQQQQQRFRTELRSDRARVFVRVIVRSATDRYIRFL